MSNNVKSLLDESKNYSEDIIPKISDILDDLGIEHETNSEETEIVLSNVTQNADSLNDEITAKIDVPKMVFAVLIDITVVDGVGYIRQKTK
jgi:hypothetical protein